MPLDLENIDITQCPTCNKKFTDRDKTLTCDVCTRKFHALCHDFTTTEYNVIQKKLGKLKWYCPNCEYGAESLHREVVSLQSKLQSVEEKLQELDTRTTETANTVEKKVDCSTPRQPK